MRKYICGVLTTLAAVLCAGCAQDEGNYDYHELNDPVITGVADSMSVLIHDQLTLDPSMGDNITDTTAYDYEWKAINRSGDNEVTVLGQEALTRGKPQRWRIHALLHRHGTKHRTLLAQELCPHCERPFIGRMDGALRC